jgi:hypothetical protein
MVTKTDFDAIKGESLNYVLLEIIEIFKDYRDHIVVVGGSVPSLLP